MKSIHFFASTFIGLIIFSCNKVDLPPTITTVNDPDKLVVTNANMDTYNGTEHYTYICSTDTSEITFSGILQSGLMKIKLVDMNNQEVYNKTFTAVSVDVYQLTAPAGNWDVSIQGVNATGNWTTTLQKQE